MKNVAIIPARSGSKGLVDKNIKMFCGKPLLYYSVRAALDSGIFSHVMVSTDSEEYADIARSAGAEVPFLRSPATSSDTASSWDAVNEVLKLYGEAGETFDMFTLLQPTSPLRTADDIRNAFSLFKEKHAFSVVSVCKTEHSPLWENVLPDDLSLNNFISRDLSSKNRQMIRDYYRINGAIYMLDVKKYSEDGFLYREGSYAYIMEALYSFDIDTETDFEIAEFLMKKYFL